MRPLALRASNLARLPGVAHGFSTRVRRPGVFDFDLRARPEAAGVAERDRAAFLDAAGLGGASLLTLGQTHEDRIFEASSSARGFAPTGPPAGFDAVVCDAPGVAIAIGTADCLPILIADRSRGAVAAVHAGWRSSALGLPALTVARLGERFGCDPRALIVALGPAIGACCFEVGPEVVDGLAARIPSPELWVVAGGRGKPHVDLALANRIALESAGVPSESIEVIPGCTVCEPDRFHSYRREGPSAGRQLSVIGVLEGVPISPVSKASSTKA